MCIRDRVNPVQPDTIRLAPPLVLTDAQAQEFLTVLPGLLDQALLDEVQ